MALWSPSSAEDPRTVSELDLNVELIHKSLFAAVTDAQLCTEHDSPGAPGYILWSRANRYLREQLIPLGWTTDNTKLILRTVHPSSKFAITAISASGSVGEANGTDVRAKNPKGAAVERVVDYNRMAPLVFGDARVDLPPDLDVSGLPTWFVFYKLLREKVSIEVSYPIVMKDGNVAELRPRLLVEPLELGGFSPDLIGPEDGPDFPVEER